MDEILQNDNSGQATQNTEQKASRKEKFFSKECLFHKNQRCDLIRLNSSTSKHQICIKCTQQEKIPLSEVLQIDDLLNADSNSFFQSFPVLTDPNLINQVEAADKQVDSIIKNTDDYFSELKEQLNSALELARSRAKTFLAKLSGLHFEMIGSYQEASKLEEFQKIIISNNKCNDDKILHDYILNLYEQSLVSTQRITKTLKSFQNLSETYDLHELQATQKQLLEIIQNINIMEDIDDGGSNIPFTVLPSINIQDSSTNLQIIKDEKGSTLITNLSSTWKQCYIDMGLQMKGKYIIRLEIIHNNNESSKSPGFAVGLIEESLKQVKQITGFKMCYGECSGGFGIDKIVKGPQLFSNKYSKEKRFLEFRIHLGSKYIRAANLPDYSSVVELDDISKIKEGEKYCFAIYISWQQDQVRIVEIIKVRSFDNKMDKQRTHIVSQTK